MRRMRSKFGRFLFWEWLGLHGMGCENWSGLGLVTSALCSYGVYKQGVECIEIRTYDTACRLPIIETPNTLFHDRPVPVCASGVCNRRIGGISQW
jgi:hypothetical protein